MSFNKRGQSLLEYSILIAVIMSALLIMQFYVKRGYQGRLKQESDKVGQQYSPGHTTSTIINDTKSISETRVEGGIQSVHVYGISPATDMGPGGKARTVVTKNESVDAFSAE